MCTSTSTKSTVTSWLDANKVFSSSIIVLPSPPPLLIPLSSPLIPSHPLSSPLIPSHPLSSPLIPSHPLSPSYVSNILFSKETQQLATTKRLTQTMLLFKPVCAASGRGEEKERRRRRERRGEKGRREGEDILSIITYFCFKATFAVTEEHSTPTPTPAPATNPMVVMTAPVRSPHPSTPFHTPSTHFHTTSPHYGLPNSNPRVH